MITFEPPEAQAGQNNVLVTITRRQSDLEEFVKVRFLSRIDQGNYLPCGQLGNDPGALQDNAYITLVSDPVTAGSNKIEILINVAAVNTPESFSKVLVENGNGAMLLSNTCFRVFP